MVSATVFAWAIALFGMGPAAAPAGGETGASSSSDASAQAVSKIFASQCSYCHTAESDSVDLTGPPSSLIGVGSSTGKPLVAPGDPDGSYLMDKLLGRHAKGELMPMGGAPLAAEELESVRSWIAGLDPADAEGAAGSEITPPPAPKRQNFFGAHQITLPTTTTLGKRQIEYRIHHRFGRIAAPRSYLGLAGGAVMSMGVSYGIIDGLDALVRWSNSNLDWELGLKYVPIRQVDGKPLSFGAYASFEALADDPNRVANRFTGNFQLMVSRLWFDRWSTQLWTNYSMLTNHASAPRVEFDPADGPVLAEDRRGSLDVGLASTVWLGKKKKYGIDLEYFVPIPDGGSPNTFYYQGGDAATGGAKYGGVSLGWSAKTGLHLFQVFITNIRTIHTNQIAPGPDGRIEAGDIYLGFNISRRWQL